MDPEQTIREMLNAIRERNIFEAREHFEDLMIWIAKGGFITGRTPEDEGWTFRAAVREDREVTLSVDWKGGVEQGGETRVVPLHAQQVALLATTSILYPAPVCKYVEAVNKAIEAVREAGNPFGSPADGEEE